MKYVGLVLGYIERAERAPFRVIKDPVEIDEILFLIKKFPVSRVISLGQVVLSQKAVQEPSQVNAFA
jgi:hypothetical protein